jgi:hypothetical protein
MTLSTRRVTDAAKMARPARLLMAQSGRACCHTAHIAVMMQVATQLTHLTYLEPTLCTRNHTRQTCE